MLPCFLASAAEHVDDLAAQPRELFPILMLGLAAASGAFASFATAFASFVLRGHCPFGGGGVPWLAWALGTIVAIATAIHTLDGHGAPSIHMGVQKPQFIHLWLVKITNVTMLNFPPI